MNSDQKILDTAISNLTLLQEPYKFSVRVVNIYQIYNNKLEFTGFSGIEPLLYDKIISNINYIHNIENKLKTLVKKITTGTPKIKIIFHYYYIIEFTLFKIKEIYTIFNNHSINISDEGSYTSSGTTLTKKYIFDLTELLEQLADMTRKLEENFRKSDILKYLTSKIDITNLCDKATEISNIYKSYYNENNGHLVINLYSYILQYLLDYTDDSNIINYILQLIETIKTQILNPTEIIVNNVNSIQTLLQWNSLIPLGASMPLQELFKTINITLNLDIDEDINNLQNISKLISNEVKIGFIIIYKITKSPLENNFWNLVDKEHLQKLDILQPSSVGVNKKTIVRSTLNYLTANSHDKIITINKKADCYYILDTLNGKDFRFLYIPEIFKDKISPISSKKLVNFGQPSIRINAYNNILNAQIVSNINKPFIKQSLLNRVDRQKRELKIKNIRTSIIRQVSKELQEVLNKSKKKNQFILVNMIDNIMEAITVRVALDTLVDIAKIPSEYLKQYYYVELTISYLKDLHKLNKNISRIILSEYKDKELKIKKANTTELIKIFEDSLQYTLEKLITSKSNIYQTVQEKSDIIINTLLL